jgi:tetratricopeptide (TPR) repeat protein
LKEATLTLEESLALARQLNNTPLIIISLLDSGIVAESDGETIKRWQEGITLARATPNKDFLAMLLALWAVNFSGNPAEEIRYIQEAYENAEEQGNARTRAYVLRFYGYTEMGNSNYASATAMLQEALRLSQELKDKHSTARCHLALGMVATWQTNYEIANRHEQASLQILRDLSDRLCSGECLFHLGWNAFLAGGLDRAIEHLEESLAIGREIDRPDYLILPTFALGRIAVSQGDIHKAKAYYLEALEALKKSPDSLSYHLAYCLEVVCAIPGLPAEKVAMFLGKAEIIRAQLSGFLPVSERTLMDPIIGRLGAQLGKETFDSARTAGATLTPPQVIDEVIAVLGVIDT